MLVKNQVYEAEITDYTAEGQGVAKIEGCAVFLPNASVGERCRVRIEKVGKTWAAGKMTLLLERSPHRINRTCPVGKLCGGCDFQHMDYEEELRLKARRVCQALNRLAGERLEAVPITGSPVQTSYRNKAQYPLALEKGRAVAGFYRSGTHQVVPTPRCAILMPQADQVKDVVLDFVNQCRVPVYDEITGKGLLRHLYVRCAPATGEVLVCLVANGNRLPHAQELAALLRQKVPGYRTLVLAVNTRPGSAILGTEFLTLDGPGYIEDLLCDQRIRLSPRSFYQVHHDQAEALYRAAIAAAGITRADTVLDLYCGAGTITLVLAQAAGKAIGVEIVPQAVEDARANAARNGAENVEFYCGDAGQAALELEARGLRPDVVVVDPPRKGLSGEAIEAMGKMEPKRIVYVSCDPATLARDIALLKPLGYALASAQAFDLFPRCAHVETGVLLSKGETDSKNIRVEFSLEDIDMSEFQDGAT